MDITQGTDSAHFTIDTNDYADKKISDKFDIAGKICSIDLILRKGDSSIPFKIKIGTKELTNANFVIGEKYSWDLNQTTAEGNHNCNGSEIEFNKQDIFEVEQDSSNIWRVVLWCNEINGKSFKREFKEFTFDNGVAAMPSYFKCRFFNERQFLVEFICKADNEDDAKKQWKKKYRNKYNLLEVLPL
jgi:hypothetical protein